MKNTGLATYDRREYRPRRTFSWRTVLFGYLRSHRRVLRRADDADAVFIDWHHPWLFFLAVGIMLLSCVDAFMTMQLIERGMSEANPVMAAVLDQGAATFAMSKLAMTGASILILVFLAKTYFMNFLRTGLLLTIFFSIYCCLVCYQIVHLLQVL
jgi:Domain of unknown function (DUF5658)